MSVLKKILGVITIAAGIAVAWIYESSTFMMVIGALIIIAGATLWVMSNQNSYDNAVDVVKIIDHIGDITLDDLFRRFGEMETPLGKAWMGSVRLIKQPCIIFGPGKDGDFVYIRQKRGKFQVAFCDDDLWLKESDEEIEKHRYVNSKSKNDDGRIVCYSTDSIALTDELYECIDSYVHDKAEYRSLDYTEDNCTSYCFSEKFNLLGQNFSLCNMDGTEIYDVKGTMPLKTFHIYEAGTKNEVFRVTKKILHLLAHYEFYQGEELIGTFRKKIDVFHDAFEMDLSEGKLEMRSISATFGDNYIVKVNHRVIGTIAYKLNFDLNNIIFDNYVIMIRDEKYNLLMTALGVMAARELVRDRKGYEDRP